MLCSVKVSLHSLQPQQAPSKLKILLLSLEERILLKNCEFKGTQLSWQPELKTEKTMWGSTKKCFNVTSFRCILIGQWKIYNWPDTGYSNLIYATPVTNHHVLWLWMHYLLNQCGVTVWEASCSSPFLRMTERQDRLWQQPLWLCSRSLPPTRLLLVLHTG